MSAGLAALATFLQGGGKIIGDVANDRNKAIAAKNRDEVLQWSERAAMEWAEEQAKAKQIEDRMIRVGMTPPTDPKERAAVMGQFGVRPEAMGTFEEFFAAGPGSKQTPEEKPTHGNALDAANAQVAQAASMEGAQLSQAKAVVDAKRQIAGKVGEVAQAASAAQDLEGGKVGLTERETSRSWKSPLADAIRPEAQRFMTETLRRPEVGTGDLDAEERRLAKRLGLAQGYSSYLQKEDFDSMREQLKQVAESRRDRLRADSDLRGNQVQIATGILGFDRTMEQTAASAEARAELEDKKIGSREKIAGALERGRMARKGMDIGYKTGKDRNDLIYKSAKEEQDALADWERRNGTIWANAKKLRGKKLTDYLAAQGVPMKKGPKGFFGGQEEIPDFNEFNRLGREAIQERAIASRELLGDAAYQQAAQSGVRPDRSKGKGKATSGGKENPFAGGKYDRK